MLSFGLKRSTLTITVSKDFKSQIPEFFKKREKFLLFLFLSVISVTSFIYFYSTGLSLLYNDARSHLDIGRRVVENLKPGFAQLGSVWLPLPHLLMTLTVWNDFMWHSGLAGAIQSMVAFITTGILVYLILKKLGVGFFGRLTGELVFVLNVNILYMQSSAMTELLLLGTMTAGVYELIMWHDDENLFRLVKAAFSIMLSTLIRYDGWFLLVFAVCLIGFHAFKSKGFKTAEGVVILFLTLAGFGIILWLFWNQMIFKDVLYFITGPYSAGTQQHQLDLAGKLFTKHNLFLSLETYFYAVIYNSGAFTVLLGILGMIIIFFDKKMSASLRIATTALLAPFFFNVLALYFGQSVLYVQNLDGSWFNVRYGLMMAPSIAVYSGYLLHRIKPMRNVLLILLLFVSFFSFVQRDAVTLDDALTGSSGKNVKEVSGWLAQNVKDKEGFVLISVASHDAIIFSSGLPMKRFIHEGTGTYWNLASTHPDRWARWIIMRTHDVNDSVFSALQYNPALKKYHLVGKYPFADIYEIKPQYLSGLETQPILAQQN